MLALPRLKFSITRPLRSIRRRVRDFFRGETAHTYFDLHNSREINSFLAAHGIALGDWQIASGNRVQRIFELREDLRKAFPLGFTPIGRRELLTWLLVWGKNDFGVTPEECIKFLHDLDTTADRGIITHYLLSPEWQKAVPDAMTPDGFEKLKSYLADRYHLQSRWFRRAKLPKVNSSVSNNPGVNVVAHFRYASGLQEAAFGVVNGLKTVGIETSKRDLPVIFPCDWTDPERYNGLEEFGTTIYIAAANTFPQEWYPKAGLDMKPGVRRIAVLYWELDEVPREWHDQLQWADEIWAPTSFIAEAFRKVVKCPVVTMLPGLELPAFKPLPRSYFSLPADKFLFLFSFDMGSVMARKNPLAAIHAFRKAFRPEEPVHLAIKISRGDSRPDDFAKLKSAAHDARVQLIDRVYSRQEVLALFQNADCYVSPHRSEGLGLGLAESMLLGKPTIATGYSGNLDFMTSETSELVNYSLIAVEPSNSVHNPYPAGTKWAEPDIDHMAELMRKVFQNQSEARAKGLAAKNHIESIMSPVAFGQRMKERLEMK